MASVTSFTGSVPQNYETYLGPLFFEPYALDIAERLGNKKYNTILELACGTGRVTKHLLKNIADDGKLYATDLNEAMIDIAKEKVADNRIIWEVADAQTLTYGDNTFDLIVCQFGVMFFPDKMKAYKEARRVLKEKGMFLFNSWNSLEHNAASRKARAVLFEIFADDSPTFFEKGPYSYFDKDQMRQHLKDAGFKNIEIETVSKIGTALTVDDVVNGLISGTPAKGELSEHNIPDERVKTTLRKRLFEQFGEKDLQLPMEAFVCMAVK